MSPANGAEHFSLVSRHRGVRHLADFAERSVSTGSRLLHQVVGDPIL